MACARQSVTVSVNEAALWSALITGQVERSCTVRRAAAGTFGSYIYIDAAGGR